LAPRFRVFTVLYPGFNATKLFLDILQLKKQ